MFTTLASEQRELLGAGCVEAQGITAPQGPTAAPGCARIYSPAVRTRRIRKKASFWAGKLRS